MTWIAANLSVIGRSHEKTSAPCQDASAYALLCDRTWMIGAVADGGGSLKHSEIGSLLAARYAVAAMGGLVRGGLFDGAAPEPAKCETFWRAVVNDVRSQISYDADLNKRHQPLSPTKHDAHQYGTTLIAFVATRRWLAAMQVGDGFLVYSSTPAAPTEDRVFETAFKAKRGEFVGEVTWLTSAQWGQDFQTRVVDTPIDFVCASTDGLEKVAIVQRDQTAFPKFFGPLRSQAEDATSDADLNGVIDSLLRMPALDRFTDDDKTMVLGRWSGA